MRVSSKGQVTIPSELRRLAGIELGSEVVFALDGGRVTIEPRFGNRSDGTDERLRSLLAALDAMEGTGDPALKAEDVMKLTRDR